MGSGLLRNGALGRAAAKETLRNGAHPSESCFLNARQQLYRTEPVPPFILTFQMRSISHVVHACQVELALCHRALGVVFQEH